MKTSLFRGELGMRAGLLLGLLLVACVGPGTAPPGQAWGDPVPDQGPYALLLGTAQDGGLPQLGCGAACCRDLPDGRRRLVTAVLIVDPASGGRWLLDAGPDLPAQVVRAAGHPPGRAQGPGRAPLFEAVVPTHAHMGHYTGLAHLGRESYGAAGQPVLATPRLAGFLREHGPWSLLVSDGHVVLEELAPDEPVALLGPDGRLSGLTLTALAVPHRDEFSDTVGLLVDGPRRSLLYLPDIDKWARWERPLGEVLDRVDVALLDGTFFADGEIPDRAMADIPHPFISETLDLLEGLERRPRARVVFTHLNHTNPAAVPGGSAQRRVGDAGCEVAHEGQVFEL